MHHFRRNDSTAGRVQVKLRGREEIYDILNLNGSFQIFQ